MKKYFFVGAFLFCGCFRAFTQFDEGARIDSLRLDSMKRILPSVRDSRRIDLLNRIAIMTNFVTPHATRIDSAFRYATMAYNEAVKTGYKKGIAMALITLSAYSRDTTMNMPGKDRATKERDIRRAVQMGEEINDDEVLGMGYYALDAKDDFEKHVDYYKRSIDHFLKAGDTLSAAEVTNWLCSDYEGRGEYEAAFDYGRKSLFLSEKTNAKDISRSWQRFLVQYALLSMVDLYTTAGDYATAMNYIRENVNYGKDNKTGWDNFDREFADLFCTMGKYDSALIYANRIDTFVPVGRFPGRSAVLGQIYLNGTKEYDKAIKEFTRCSDTVNKYLADTIYATAQYLIYIGQAYDGKKNYNTALQYAKKGTTLVEEKNQRPLMLKGYQALSTIYHHLSNNDSAYEYLLKYNTIKDSIENKQLLLRIYNSKKDAEDEKRQAQILLLDKDNKIKDEELKQESLVRNFLIGGLLVLLIAGIFVYRSIALKRRNEKLRLENELTVQRLESERRHAELKRQASDLQMRALRAQMNPHFIFNSLSSINWFIMENDKDIASDYLTRFSRLMRMVLNAQKPMIPLEDELKMLQLYLDMERLRLEYSFDYSITFTNAMDAGSVSIPPMLLQPFCENAIWHGFRNKEGQGRININIRTEDQLLECMITDNGIGREQAAAFKKKSPKKEGSMGLAISRERLALFSEENNADASFEMEDLTDENGAGAGTRVTLKIAYNKVVEEMA